MKTDNETLESVAGSPHGWRRRYAGRANKRLRVFLAFSFAVSVIASGCGSTGGGKTFTVGGSVTGLSGGGLTLQNGAEVLAISASGAFTFKTPVASYAVTVATQPSGPTQACTVTNGIGTATTNVTNVTVTCATSRFQVGGIVTGLAGAGLVLQNNNTDDLSVGANGTFTFSTSVDSGNAFSVTVKTQPSVPTQTCRVSGGTGAVGSGNVTGVVVNCQTDRFTVGGQVSGLAGASVVLQNNGGADLTVNANGGFAFPTTVASGAAYAVTVLTQPSSPAQTCSVSSGVGTVGSENLTSVRVTCSTNRYAIGGTVTGLIGTGLVLQDNASDTLTISTDGAFTFTGSVASGAAYAVTVLTQPSGPTQTCAVTSGSGVVGAADVTNVSIACSTNRYIIGGTVSGLAGSGLVLENGGGDALAVSADGTFVFATDVLSGGTYAVTVFTQPSSPAQTCTVSGGTGTVVSGNVTSITVNCATNTYAVGGTVSGLAGTLALQDNGGDDLSVTTNGSFAFATPVPSGATYAVTVLAQPGQPSQTCVVTDGGGTVASSNVTTVTITCTTNSYTIGGTVTGLSGTGLMLQDSGGDDLSVTADGPFAFATPVPSGEPYAVTVLAQPGQPSQTCVITNGAGTVGGANVTGVSIACTTNRFHVGGTVTGLVGTGLVLQDNGGDDLAVGANGTFAFATPISDGATYRATVLSNPVAPGQTCVVSNGTGTVASGDVTTVTVDCTTNACSVACSVAFDYTGAEQQWVVPAGVTSIDVDVRGAQGAGPSLNNGARVQTTLSVTPGETLHVYVGGAGGADAASGYNGGGIAFYTGNYHNGGGGSDIRRAGVALANRVVVAGGGGGYGYGGNYGGTNGHGGAGGYNGASGYGCLGGGYCGPGGGGATQSGGGVGGADSWGHGGTNGALGVGGDAFFYYGGGGGGGGYYGGGGGGGEGSGGGGGSSNSQGTSTTYTDGYQSGHGQVIIRY